MPAQRQGDPFGLGLYCGMKGTGSLNIPSPLSPLPSYHTSGASHHWLCLRTSGNTSSFFSSHLDVGHDPSCEFWPQRGPGGAPTSSMRIMKVALCPAPPPRRPCRSSPRGGHVGASRAHLGLGGILLPQAVCAVVGHNSPIPKGYWSLSVVVYHMYVCSREACMVECAKEQEWDRDFTQLHHSVWVPEKTAI